MNSIRRLTIKESIGLLLSAAGLRVLLASFPGPIAPPGADGDRPDTRLRKGVDPGEPPAGYYDSASPPLRRQVLEGLTAARNKLARRWRK